VTRGDPKNKTPTKDNQEGTSTDQRGTESSPLFMKVVPPLPIKPSPADHAKQTNDYVSPEWGIVWVTFILAGYSAKPWGATKSLAKMPRKLLTGRLEK
jgi:hypothetical protein